MVPEQHCKTCGRKLSRYNKSEHCYACASGRFQIRFPSPRERSAAVIEPEPSKAAKQAARVDLSAREKQIVEMIADGAANNDIANKLSISPETVKRHLTNIFDIVGVGTRLELARWVWSRKEAEYEARIQELLSATTKVAKSRKHKAA